MIKNWTVVTRQIKNASKGLIGYANYLLDTSKASHAATKIIQITDTQVAAGEILHNHEYRQALRRKSGKRGGGVRNYATSFTLSLPKDISQPTTGQWRIIAAKVVKAIADTNNLDPKKVWKSTCAVIHNETLRTKNNHLHLIISNIHEGEFIKGITQHKTTYAVKGAFNSTIKEELNVDYRTYIPKKSNKPNKPLWLARAEKAEKAEGALRLLKKYLSQLDRWAKYVIERNEKRKKSTEKRLSQTANDLSKLNLSKPTLTILSKAIKTVEKDLKIKLPSQSSRLTKRRGL